MYILVNTPLGVLLVVYKPEPEGAMCPQAQAYESQQHDYEV